MSRAVSMPSFICRPNSLAGPVRAALMPSVMTGFLGLATAGGGGGGVREARVMYQPSTAATRATAAPTATSTVRREASRAEGLSGGTRGGGATAAGTGLGGLLMLTTGLGPAVSRSAAGREGRGAASEIGRRTTVVALVAVAGR